MERPNEFEKKVLEFAEGLLGRGLERRDDYLCDASDILKSALRGYRHAADANRQLVSANVMLANQRDAIVVELEDVVRHKSGKLAARIRRIAENYRRKAD